MKKLESFYFIIKLKDLFKLFILSLLIFIIRYDYGIEIQIQKELSQVEHNAKSLNWENIKNDFIILANKYKYLIKKDKYIPENSPIWVMWYQGIENAPLIVKSCIDTIIKNRGKHRVYIIDKYNLAKYIKLPSYITEKLNNKSFSITHLSDIIRMGLIFKYGGYWIDSTIFITTPITKFNGSFFSLKKRTCFKHPFIKCKWVAYLLASSKHSFFATYCYLAFLFYWKKYDRLLTYFLIDYIIDIAYQFVKEFKKIIDNLPYDTCKIWLAKMLNKEYNPSYFRCHFNKLSYKRPLNLSVGKKTTNLGYIIDKFKLSLKHSENIF